VSICAPRILCLLNPGFVFKTLSFHVPWRYKFLVLRLEGLLTLLLRVFLLVDLGCLLVVLSVGLSFSCLRNSFALYTIQGLFPVFVRGTRIIIFIIFIHSGMSFYIARVFILNISRIILVGCLEDRLTIAN